MRRSKSERSPKFEGSSHFGRSVATTGDSTLLPGLLLEIRSRFVVWTLRVGSCPSGTFSRNSVSQTSASESLGARQSPRGESEPPDPTFGPFGIAERLNWLILKNRNTNTSSHFFIVERSYSNRLSGGSKSGQSPRFLSPHAWLARKATLLGLKP